MNTNRRRFLLISLTILFPLGSHSATYTVGSTNDSGSGSLRQAILDSNSSTGVLDTIAFDIPPGDPGHVYYRDDGVAGQVTPASVSTTTESDDASLGDVDPDWPHSWYSTRPQSPPSLYHATLQLGGPPAFFDHNVPLPPKDETCPVTLSGKYILDLAHGRNRTKPNGRPESYSDKQLEILRECNYLLHTQDKEVLVALSTMMKTLLAFAVSERKIRFESMPFVGNGN